MTKPPLMHLRGGVVNRKHCALCEVPLPKRPTKYSQPQSGEALDGHGWVHAYTKATCPDCLWMKMINDAEVHLQRQERIMAHYDSVCALIVKAEEKCDPQ